jgi:hypothetical protein
MPLLRESKAVIVKYLSQLVCLAAFNVPSVQLQLHFAFYLMRII